MWREQLSSFFTIARFGPDSILIFVLLGILGSVIYELGFIIPAIAVAGAFSIIFWAESVETIQLKRVEPRKIIGSRCLVVKQIGGRASRGIVKMYKDESGDLEHELWSAESNLLIEKGKVATVKGISSIILFVE